MSGEDGSSSTGEPRVGRILEALDVLDDLPVSEHAGLYLDVHDRLAAELVPERRVREAGAHGAS